MANGKNILMGIDTGAAVSIISEKLFQNAFSVEPLDVTGIMLKMCTEELISVLGQFQTTVNYENQNKQLPLVVVKGARPALYGRNWLQKLTLN